MLKEKRIRRFPIQNIKNILHVSDVHIRNLKRHKEYNEVFNRLYSELRKRLTGDTVICVTGDIAHSKTDISPELVKMISDFYVELARIAPVITIVGNHDANLSNKNRLDVLTPILTNIDNNNIFFLRDSGVYRLGDIDFVVWSVFDDPSLYIQASEVESDLTKILLYHGPVETATTDVGYTISNHSVTLDKMNGFDFVILGDIHKRQILQEFNLTEMEIDEDNLPFYLSKGWELV